MIKTIDGITFKNMVDYAVRNLNKHRKTVNQLNVFPVPDGDTGTNMVTTIHKGLLAVNETLIKLPEISSRTMGRKYTSPVMSTPRKSDTMAETAATTGPKTMAPRALARKAVLIFRFGARGMATSFNATRMAIIRAANTSILVSFSSAAASRQ